MPCGTAQLSQSRVCCCARYWHDKGLVCIVTGRVLNLAALGFTIAFSGVCPAVRRKQLTAAAIVYCCKQITIGCEQMAWFHQTKMF
jgi:hypothetical protein